MECHFKGRGVLHLVNNLELFLYSTLAHDIYSRYTEFVEVFCGKNIFGAWWFKPVVYSSKPRAEAYKSTFFAYNFAFLCLCSYDM